MADSSSYNRGSEEEDEEEEIDETSYKTVKDAVLFAIDVSKSMLTPPTAASDSKKGDRDTPTLAALKCAYALMQQRIISNPNDMMGVLLYGTEESKFHQKEASSRGQLAYPHCYLLADLDVPCARDVKRLKSMVEDEEESKKLLVPSNEPVVMSNVLFCANQIFTTKAPNFSSRRLFLVTDCDDPHPNDKAARSAAAVRAKDLYDLGVVIELFPISRPGHTFDRSKFYDDIVYRTSPLDPEAPAPVSSATEPSSTGDGISLLQSLLSAINAKSVPKRALFSNRIMEIAPGLKISVKGYIIFKRQVPARSCYVWLNSETPQIATGKTTLLADDTARTVEKVELKKAYKFGGESVMFTPEELSALRNFGDPVIRIIGFKPLSMLPIWASIKQATFIYPSEEDYVGSTRVFSSLQQKLLKDQKMAVAWFIARRNAVPAITAIIPGPEKLENGQQIRPPGMWIIPLPYADDIRQNPETSLVVAPDSVVDRMRKVVQQLQLPKAQYDPRKYPNPALQWHYRILQALALEEDLPEKPEDKTIPRYKQIDKVSVLLRLPDVQHELTEGLQQRAGEYVIKWGKELEEQFSFWQREHTSKSTAHKRSAQSALENGDGGPVKKARTVPVKKESQGGFTEEDMREHFDKNTVEKLTLPVLREWLKSKTMNTAGKKADLVERVEAYFETK